VQLPNYLPNTTNVKIVANIRDIRDAQKEPK